MNTLFNRVVLAMITIFALNTLAFAQTTHLRTVETSAFNKVQLSIDTEVILIKSTRNHVTLVGDSAYIVAIPVIAEDGTLSINYQTEPDFKLKRVAIEYTELNHATTGGTGTYYFHKTNEDNLVVFNPYARVIMSGNTEYIRVVSQEGVTDLTALNTQISVLHIGDDAKLMTSEAQ